MNNWFENFFLKEQFSPSVFGLFINPFYFGKRALLKNITKYSGLIRGRTLDIGCGRKPYQHLFKSEQYIGIDVLTSGHNHTNSKVDVFYDGLTIPFENQHFDSVVCFEVLQAVFSPDLFIEEASRVLKNGGSAIFTAPFMWDECEPPYDYARYTSFGLKHLLDKHGFQIVNNEKLLCDLRLLALLSNAYLDKVIRRLIPSRFRYFLLLPITSIVNLFGIFLLLFPNNRDMYFGNLFVLKKSEESHAKN